MELNLSATEQKIYEGVYEYAIELGRTEKEATKQATQRILEIRRSIDATVKMWTK
jgi:hypothetical protein